ncbi:Transcription factor WhiB [Actinopolyspora mzabensis]|uniref:Transcriptional regulator WhiB n=1 Tax=Actinopolyspora mzabensis TaxID=995066 RepID=A0A1G8WH95_ACTMZ|nr:Transcription factor WhiB [Actinopolyspora mzabensis]
MGRPGSDATSNPQAPYVSGRFTSAGNGPVPPPVIHYWDWQLRAACRGVDPNIFFAPDGETRNDRERRQRVAKSICQDCPVRQLCLNHAHAVGETYGVWGGYTELERSPRNRRGGSP